MDTFCAGRGAIRAYGSMYSKISYGHVAVYRYIADNVQAHGKLYSR